MELDWTVLKQPSKCLSVQKCCYATMTRQLARACARVLISTCVKQCHPCVQQCKLHDDGYDQPGLQRLPARVMSSLVSLDCRPVCIVALRHSENSCSGRPEAKLGSRVLNWRKSNKSSTSSVRSEASVQRTRHVTSCHATA